MTNENKIISKITYKQAMINKTSIPRSNSSHGGTLYYVYEIPVDEYHYSRKASSVTEHKVYTKSYTKR